MTEKRPSDLPTRWKRAPNGEMIAVKVVQSDSETLEYDLLAAFRSNVRRLKRERRERAKDADIAA